MRKFVIISVIGLGLVGVLTFVLSRSQSITVGLVAPFSGSRVKEGADFQRGMMLAFEDSGQWFRPSLEVCSTDYESDPGKIAIAVKTVTGRCQTKILVGDMEWADAVANRRVIEEAKVSLLVPFGEQRKLGAIHSLAGGSESNLEILRKLITEKLKLSTVAYIGDANSVMRVFVEEGKLGSNVLRLASLTSSPSALASFLKAREAIVLPASLPELANVVHKLKSAHYAGQIVVWADELSHSIRALLKTDGLGVYVIGLAPPEINQPEMLEFTQKFKAKFKDQPSYFSVFGFSIGKALRQNPNPEKLLRSIEDGSFSKSIGLGSVAYRINQDEDELILD